MFRSALIKLTLSYLAIIMIISFFFSLNLYRISTIEIDNALSKQKDFFYRGGREATLNNPEFTDYMQQRLIESKKNIFYQLLYTNIIILIAGGGVSCFFARLTLRPIEESHEAQSRFAADASHELRSPLSAMKTEIEVTLREPEIKKEEAIKVLKSNLEEVDKLQKLSEGLLELARNNGDSLAKGNVFVKDFVEKAIVKITKEAKAKKIIIKENIDNKLLVFGNKESLVELVSILLENSIKYSEENKEILITAQKKNKFVEFKIKDEGFGIGKDDLAHIFNRFYRADLSRSKNKINGYGLGLSIAKKIVESNNGKIDVESIEGSGSTFIIALPEKRN